ncbi:MAG: hypothetical protein ACYC9O_16025 [Candidatus Latescibacterota bacterium]
MKRSYYLFISIALIIIALFSTVALSGGQNATPQANDKTAVTCCCPDCTCGEACACSDKCAEGACDAKCCVEGCCPKAACAAKDGKTCASDKGACMKGACMKGADAGKGAAAGNHGSMHGKKGEGCPMAGKSCPMMKAK